MPKGTIRRLITDRGFGFIRTEQKVPEKGEANNEARRKGQVTISEWSPSNRYQRGKVA